AAAAEPAAVPPADAPRDPRPVIRLRVKNEYQRDDLLLAQIVEGRLVTDLADMETFRTVTPESPGDYLLTCSIRSLNVSAGDYAGSLHEAQAGPTPRATTRISLSMDLDLVLENAAGKEVYRGKLAADGGRDLT